MRLRHFGIDRCDRQLLPMATRDDQRDLSGHPELLRLNSLKVPMRGMSRSECCEERGLCST